MSLVSSHFVVVLVNVRRARKHIDEDFKVVSAELVAPVNFRPLQLLNAGCLSPYILRSDCRGSKIEGGQLHV